jgi:hypothetical protein
MRWYTWGVGKAFWEGISSRTRTRTLCIISMENKNIGAILNLPLQILQSREAFSAPKRSSLLGTQSQFLPQSRTLLPHSPLDC